MTLLDRVLVAAGRSYAAISSGGRSPVRARVLIVLLLLLSLVTIVAISLISIPSEKSFDDLRERRYRGLEWLRLEGDLREAGRDDGRYLYVLHDPANPTVAVTVYAPGPLPTGATQVTGQERTDARLPGTFDTFYADAVHGTRTQRPVGADCPTSAYRAVPDRRRASGVPCGASRGSSDEGRGRHSTAGDGREGGGALERLAAGGDPAARHAPRLHARGRPRCGGEHAYGRRCARRSKPCGASGFPATRRPRLSGPGCTPHLEIHAPGGDVLFEFGSVEDRNRVAEALGNPTSRP